MNTKAIDRALLNQVKSRLRLVEDMIARLHYFIREVQADGGINLESGMNNRSRHDANPPNTLPAKSADGSRRRSELLRRATLSLLESARKGARF